MIPLRGAAACLLLSVPALTLSGCLFAEAAPPAGTPGPGGLAADSTLTRLDGRPVSLHALAGQGPVALVVLRGYPGYQCPLCNRQVGELLERAKDFQAAGAQMVVVYPGRAQRLGQYAAEFVAGRSMPPNLHFTTDPDFAFAQTWNLRWNAPGETVYPAAFVIGRDRRITWAKVSGSHGGRASADELLAAVKAAR